MWFIRKPPAGLYLTPVICIAAVLLSSCGFRPLYKIGGRSDEAALATIEISGIKDVIGQQLRNRLIKKFSPRGRSKQTHYTLTVTVTESKAGLAIRKDETATRANLTISASFKLVALRGPRRRTFAGRTESINSYNVLTSNFATLSAERDARNRALITIAEEIRLRVASALLNPSAFSAPPVAGVQR